MNLPKELGYSVVVDVVFILLLIISLSIVFQGLATNIIGISNVFQENNEEITDEITSTQGVRNLLSTLPNFTKFYQGLIEWTLVFFALTYVLISVFQGIAFWIAYPKVKFVPYYLKFFGINVLWLILSGLIFYFGIKMSVRQYGSFIPIFSQEMINVFIIILFVILGYFVVHSYVYLPKRKLLEVLKLTFKSILLWKKHLLPYLGVLGVLLIGIIIFVFLTNAKPYLGMVFALVVLLPSFYFSRVFLIKSFV